MPCFGIISGTTDCTAGYSEQKYRRSPTTANLAALRARVEADYDQVIVRKRAKLAELERTARHAWKIEEMRAIVEETERDRAFPAAP